MPASWKTFEIDDRLVEVNADLSDRELWAIEFQFQSWVQISEDLLDPCGVKSACPQLKDHEHRLLIDYAFNQEIDTHAVFFDTRVISIVKFLKKSQDFSSLYYNELALVSLKPFCFVSVIDPKFLC